MNNEKFLSLLNFIAYLIIRQNTSTILKFPIKIDNENYYLYKIDCIKCLLQEIIKSNDFKNIDLNKSYKTYKEFIIRYAQQYNERIKENFNKYKFNITDLKFYVKPISIDEILLLSNKELEQYINKIYFYYDVKLIKINIISSNYIDYDIYIVTNNNV